MKVENSRPYQRISRRKRLEDSLQVADEIMHEQIEEYFSVENDRKKQAPAEIVYLSEYKKAQEEKRKVEAILFEREMDFPRTDFDEKELGYIIERATSLE